MTREEVAKVELDKLMRDYLKFRPEKPRMQKGANFERSR